MFASQTRIAFAALTLALMGVAHAGPETVTVTGPAAKPLRGLNPSEAEAIVGAYRMSDGRLMVLKQRGRAIVANLDGVPLTRLLAGEAGTLQAADDSMRMRFETDPQTETTAVTVSLRVDGNSPVTLAAAKSTLR
jgi:hypothetical protein